MMHKADDFDFLHGDWDVRHRKLATRLEGADDWFEFTGTVTVWPLMGGSANIDDNVLDDPGGTYQAASLRCFDARTGLWRIWWLDSRFPDRLDVPVEGRFDGDCGEFVAVDEWQGKPLLTRFRWVKDAGEGPRWEQAMSIDDGVSWETNWIMDFRRRD